MTVSMFDSRTMLQAMEQMYPPASFLLDLFFKEENFALTETVDIDIIKGNRKMAPLVRPISEAKVVERLGYQTNTIKPPYIKQKMKTTAQDLLTRPYGLNMYVAGGMSLVERAAKQLNSDLQYLEGLILRREEWMAAQVLDGGVVNLVGEGVNQQVDFQMPNDNQADATVAWDQTTSDPITDLMELARTIQKASGITPNKIIMGFTAISNFLKHADVQKVFDNRRLELGMINPSLGKMTDYYVGVLRIPGLVADIYGYNESYIDDNGASQWMIPETKIIMGSDKARCSRQYAVIQDLKAGEANAVRWFPKSWETEDPSCRWLMLQSAPLVCLHQADAFGTLETDPSE